MRFVATEQEKDELITSSCKIDPISRALVEAQLKYSVPDLLPISDNLPPFCNLSDSFHYIRSCSTVFKSVKPSIKFGHSLNLVHRYLRL